VIAIAVIALGLAGVIAALSLGEGEHDPIEIEGAGAVQRLFGGIPQDGAVLGSDSAPLTVQLFNDLQCEGCAAYQIETLPALVDGPVRDGEIRLEYRHFPITGQGLASFGAVAAGEQGRQWQYVQLFFINQDEAENGQVTQDLLDRIAAAVLELDVDQWRDDLEDPEIPDVLEADTRLAVDRRLPDEPAVVVDGPRGTRELTGSPSLAEVEMAIAAVS
jgi:protein-disulfide isomerase